MKFGKLLVVLVILISASFIKADEIQDILDKIELLKNPSLQKIFQSTLKEQIKTSIKDSLSKIKTEAEFYNGKNKEIVDKLEANLNKYVEASNIFEQEKYLNSILNQFRDLVKNNENFAEKRRMINLTNSIEKASKFLMEYVEKISEEKSGIIPNMSGLNPSVKPSDYQPNMKDDPKDINTKRSEHFLSPISIVLVVAGIAVIIGSIYCIYSRKKRVTIRDVEYIPHNNEI